tara:strand:- start:22504 stop:23001 length:498 start_codon:yes stop_codon:yes gene_type:complete
LKEYVISFYKHYFGAGPTGILATIIIWIGAKGVGETIHLPALPLGETPRAVLVALFLIDSAVTIVWSLVALPPKERSVRMVRSGPFKLVRHPLYSAVIWSGTGAVALWLKSWSVLFSVVPISLFWTWHIRDEEAFMVEKFGDEYRDYMKRTGQFFPIFRREKREQ